jgi:transcriptional regulator with XRE-family HTH domain
MRGWLITARKNKNWTQNNVAEMVNISRSYYSEIENGKKNPSGKVAIKISKLFGLKPEKFFE